MRKLLNVIFAAALVGGAYGITKGVMYYRVHTTLQDLVDKASPHGDLAYGRIETSVTGKVAVHDVTYRPAGATDDVRVDTIRIVGPNAWFFVHPDVSLGGADAPVPPRLHISAEAIRLQNNDWSHLAGWKGSAPSEACASHTPLNDGELLSKLGFDELVIDFDMGWNAAESSRELTASFGLYIHGMQSLQASATLADITLAALQDGQAMPQLGGFEWLANIEPQFGEKLISVCAERLKISPSDYRKRLVAHQRAAAHRAGINLGPGLVFALESFVSQWGEIKLVARPQAPLGLMSLAFLPRNRVVDQLGLMLQVNDTLVTDLSFSTASGEQGSWADLFNTESQATEPRRVKPRYRRSWQRITPHQLPEYVSREVRVYSADQPMRAGTLISVSDRIAEVQQRVHGGHYTAHVQLAQITRAEVRVRKLITPVKAASASAAQ